MRRTLWTALITASLCLGGATPVGSTAGDHEDRDCTWKRVSIQSRIQFKDSTRYTDENGDEWVERQRVTAVTKKRCHQYKTRITLSDWYWDNLDDDVVVD